MEHKLVLGFLIFVCFYKVDNDVGMDLVRVEGIYMVKTCCIKLKILKKLMGKDTNKNIHLA